MDSSFAKLCLTQALFQLLERKPMESITVSELIERAGVSRSSFYRNYLNMNAILEEYLQMTFAEIRQNCAAQATTVRQYVLLFFAAVRQCQWEFSVLLKRDLLGMLWPCFYKMNHDRIQQMDVLDNRYQPYYFAGATCAMLCAWIEFGFADSEADMADNFIKSLHGYADIHADVPVELLWQEKGAD